jgi:glycolate oxidase FAD binding subunit
MSQAHVGAVLVGGGSRLGIGNRPSRDDVLLLSTRGLSGVLEFDPAEGVCHVAAGTPLSEVRAAVRSEGWELPLDAIHPNSTVGGVLSAAAVGPRVQAFGRPRDVVLGLSVVLANGEHTRCGGRVVKNVTGYDLNKLYTGSFGTLGVIVSAWLRLHPRPEKTACFQARAADLASLAELAREAAKRPTARAVAVDASPAEARLAIELAGDVPDVESDMAWLEGREGIEVAGADAVDRVAAGTLRRTDCLRFRVDALETRFDGLLERLLRDCDALVAYPALGLAYAEVEAPTERPGVDAAFDRAARWAREAGGGYVCESAPAQAKRDRDVFGGAAALPILRSLKQRFDPGGLLNPGRFAGRL